MAINCSGCHAYCCRKIGLLDPTLDRGDCTCKYLDESTCKCKIYESRPLICNTDRLYDAVFNFMPRDEYDANNALGCKSLKELFIERKED